MLQDVSISVRFNGLQIGLVKTEWEKVIPSNQQLIIDFDRHSKSLELKESTRTNNIKFLILFAKSVKKSFKRLTQKDIDNYIESLECSKNTKVQYINNIRKFLRWLELDIDLPYIKGDIKRMKATELITEDEIQTLIESCREPGEKALISVLYDSACRIGEIASLRRRDVKVENGQWLIAVDGKTGVRNIPLMFSQQYLQVWMDKYHPRKVPDAPLWTSRSSRFKYTGEKALSRNAIWRIVKNSEHIIGKKLHPHLFRHSRLTELASKGMPEFMMRSYAGWTDSSTMTAVYLHSNLKGLTDKLKEITNPEYETTKPKKSILMPKECPRCHAENNYNAQFCEQCYLPIDVEVAMEEMAIVEMLRSKWYADIKKQAIEKNIPFEKVEPKVLVKVYQELTEKAKVKSK
jgi:integrase